MAHCGKKLSVIIITTTATVVLLWQVANLVRSDLLPFDKRTKQSTITPVTVSTTSISSIPANPKTQMRQAVYFDVMERYHFAKLKHQLLQEQLAIANLQQQIFTIKQNSNFTDDDDKVFDSIEIKSTTIAPDEEANSPAIATKAKEQPSENPSPIEARSQKPLQQEKPNKPQAAQVQRDLDEIVLLAMPASSYTIKLFSAESHDTLVKFAKDHNLTGSTLCYSNKAKLPLYTMLYGDYLTEAAAKSALASLPKDLQAVNPRIEKLEIVQKQLQEN